MAIVRSLVRAGSHQTFSPSVLPMELRALGCEAGEYVVLAYKADTDMDKGPGLEGTGTSRGAPSSPSDSMSRAGEDTTSTSTTTSRESSPWGVTAPAIVGAGAGLVLAGVLAVVVRRRHVRRSKQRAAASGVDASAPASLRCGLSATRSGRLPWNSGLHHDSSSPRAVPVHVAGLRHEPPRSFAQAQQRHPPGR
jgi:hypothetical protein